MKSIKPLLALCALSLPAMSQPFNGQTTYDHNSNKAILTAGSYVASSGGFIMAGYQPSYAGGLLVYVDKVDRNGNVGSSSGLFSNYFNVLSGGRQCLNNFTPEVNCYGVAIKRTGGGSLDYLMAGTFDSGVILTGLGLQGNLTAMGMYPFPANATGITKPVLIDAPSGDYYFCGSYHDASRQILYVVYPQSTLYTSNWTVAYDAGQNTDLIPYAMVKAIYNGSPVLAIVGSIRNNGDQRDGFLMTLDATNGNLINFTQYDVAGRDDLFASIALSSNPNFSPGYIIGGYMTPSNTNGNAWMIRIDNSGAINFSSQVQASTDPSAGEVVAVFERRSAANNAYEYYGASTSNVGSIVMKLDDSGNPYNIPAGVNNEFMFDDGSGNISAPVAMSFYNGPTPANVGFHVFARTDNSSPQNYYLIQSYFNGVSGNCSAANQKQTTLNQTNPVTPIINSPAINNYPPLQFCTGGYTPDSPIVYAANQLCMSNGNPGTPNGSNQRTLLTTSLAEVDGNKTGGISIYPNPVNTAMHITYSANGGGDVSIDLYNTLGQHVKTLDKGYRSGENTVDADLGKLDLQNGVYLVRMSVNGSISQQAIVFNKN